MKELCARFGIDEADLRAAIASDLEKIPVAAGRTFDIHAIPGGASNRGYCRITLAGADRGIVLMVLSDPDPAKGVEEVMASGVITELPFVNVHRHLAASSVPVPEIYYYNQERGLLYNQDCGTIHLRHLLEAGRDIARMGFEAAITELVKVHLDATRRPDDNFLGFKARFDHKLLRWELDHFTEFAIQQRFPGMPGAEDERRIGELYEEICDELLAGPYALQHRDYQLDNLLWQDGRMRVIDFQDALMGPLAYDLACLLYDRDTSVLLGPALIRHLVTFYGDRYEERSGEKLDRAMFQRNFELCVIHRMLKVVGRFHFINIVKKRPEYLRFNRFMLPAILDYLGRSERERELLRIIVKYVPELRELAGR